MPYPFDDLCPCASQHTYKNCCAPLHQKKVTAKTAEALMRSRFAAFYLASITESTNQLSTQEAANYLTDTLHPPQWENRNRQKNIESLLQSFPLQQWVSLKIIQKEKGQCGDKTGTVEFVAFYLSNPHQSNDIAEQLHELSQFVFENGQWLYSHGEFKPPIKLQRNDPCWCGSAKKLKKCHEH